MLSGFLLTYFARGTKQLENIVFLWSQESVLFPYKNKVFVVLRQGLASREQQEGETDLWELSAVVIHSRPSHSVFGGCHLLICPIEKWNLATNYIICTSVLTEPMDNFKVDKTSSSIISYIFLKSILCALVFGLHICLCGGVRSWSYGLL